MFKLLPLALMCSENIKSIASQYIHVSHSTDLLYRIRISCAWRIVQILEDFQGRGSVETHSTCSFSIISSSSPAGHAQIRAGTCCSSEHTDAASPSTTLSCKTPPRWKSSNPHSFREEKERVKQTPSFQSDHHCPISLFFWSYTKTFHENHFGLY